MACIFGHSKYLKISNAFLTLFSAKLLLHINKKTLGIQTPGKPCERAVGTYHSVAWHKQTHLIRSHSLCHRSHTFCVSQPFGYLHVASCFALGYARQRLPHT